jgi:hypothetical protein
MYAIQAGLTSAISLPLPLVMVAFAFQASLFRLPVSHLTTSRQRPTTVSMPSKFPQILGIASRQCYHLDKEISQETNAAYARSLYLSTCLVFPLSDKPNNPALSSKALLGIHDMAYIYRSPAHLLNILSPATTTHIPSPYTPTNPKPNPTEKKALVADHTEQTCATSRTPSPAATRPPSP